MPRKARIDAPGALHHIICRGIERRSIFISDIDRDDFVQRLNRMVTETETLCYAWALIPNHFHLLLQTGNTPIATLMHRLLTGYAVSFNHRHQRHGRLFQNRYKSILCQQETYLLELVRYIHLNPLRASIVDDLRQLDRFAYCGHSRITGRINDGWQAVDPVLTFFDSKTKTAQRRYHHFLENGIVHGKRPELTGGGLLRSAGGWGVLKSKRRMGEHLKGDERILGDTTFVEDVLGTAQEDFDHRYRLASSGITFERIVAFVATRFELTFDGVLSPSKQPLRARARSVVAYLSVKQLGMTGTEVGELLGISQSAISRAVIRGEAIAMENNLRLPTS